MDNPETYGDKMTPLDRYLSEVDEREKRTTPGPWECGGSGTVICDCVEGSIGFEVIATKDVEYLDRRNENRVFIAHSRTDILRLLEIIRIQGEALEFYSKEPHSRSEMKRLEIMDAGKKARTALERIDEIVSGV